jgi:inosine-uridine nucleoside N-ribohydrolase
MTTPLLIDTDMGVDDAVAVSLALASPSFDLHGVIAVGGRGDLDQVMKNIGGLLAALSPPAMPPLGRGLDPPARSDDRPGLFEGDDFGKSDLPLDQAPPAADFKELYQEAIDKAGGELTILATGPLSNLAALLKAEPDSAGRIKHVYLTGGAVWTGGNVNEFAEFNFYRDPQAAADVLASGLPVTVAPLDVTRLVYLDESHVARLAASGYRTAEVLAKLLQHPLQRDDDPACGKCCLHDAVTVGSIIWPNLFLKTRMRLDIVTHGAEAGRCRPALGGEESAQVDLLTAVNAVDFIENLLESLCHEAFVV